LVEVFLVFPLAVVKLGRGIASSVQGDEEAVAISRLGAVGGVPKGHDFAVEDEVLVLPGLLIFRLGVGEPLGGERLCLLLGLRLGEGFQRENRRTHGLSRENCKAREEDEEGEKVMHTLFFYACGYAPVISCKGTTYSLNNKGIKKKM
jgi:hypothetical protein